MLPSHGMRYRVSIGTSNCHRGAMGEAYPVKLPGDYEWQEPERGTVTVCPKSILRFLTIANQSHIRTLDMRITFQRRESS